MYETDRNCGSASHGAAGEDPVPSDEDSEVRPLGPLDAKTSCEHATRYLHQHENLRDNIRRVLELIWSLTDMEVRELEAGEPIEPGRIVCAPRKIWDGSATVVDFSAHFPPMCLGTLSLSPAFVLAQLAIYSVEATQPFRDCGMAPRLDEDAVVDHALLDR